MARFSLLIAGFLLLALSTAHAQVVINEYSASNVGGLVDSYGENEDWAELYNTSGTPFDLTGYFLSDRSTNLMKWQIPSGTVPANGRLMIHFSGRGTVSGSELHPNFKLTQTKQEWIILSDAAGVIVDSIHIARPTQATHSWARESDGSATWKVSLTPTPNAANVGGDNYYTATPLMSLAAGFYNGSQTVNITTTDATATIYYTTDGSEPTTGSTVYGGPITVSNTTVVRARSFSSDPDVPPSFTETSTYFIDESHTLPVVSVSGTEVDDLLNGNSGLYPEGVFELFKNQTFIDESVGEFNKHGNDSWAYDQRGFDYITRDQMGYTYAIKDQLFTNKSRDKFQRVIMKPAANDNYPFEDGAHIRDAYVHVLSQLAHLRMDERSNRACVLYMNGQYWGVYEIREKVDDNDFTEYYYDQGEFEMDFLKTWGPTWAEYGDRTDWDQLVGFINANSMAVPANYQHVKSRYNVGSLIDYTVLNSYIVTADWLNWNTAWWRGKNPNGTKKKYRYALWDMDASFGHYINYTGIPDQSANADPCNPEGLSGGSDPEGHMTILNKLVENDTFRAEYINRFADLNNTYFKCDYMHHVLDSMIADIAPEMPAQVALWGGTVAQWEANVQTLKQFIDDRCAAITAGLIDCYNLTGPWNLTVDVSPAGAGLVKVNSIWIPSYPYTGQYYGNILTFFDVDANTGYDFSHWSFDNHTPNPNTTDKKVSVDLQSDDNVVAYFIPEGEEPLYDGLSGVAVPNIFSPNDDGINDVLDIFVGTDVQDFTLHIFDRWGNEVFRSESKSNEWDGRYRGELLNTGVFTYMIDINFHDNTNERKTGNVTLMR